MQSLVALLLVAFTRAHAGRAGADASDVPKLDIEKYTLAERPRGDPVRGSPRAARRRGRLVSRRARARSAGPHGLRAPVRAHDVPGLEARARATRTSGCSRAPAQRGVNGTTEFRSHELLRDGAVEPARAGAVARVRSHGLPARRRSIRPSCRTSRTSSATSGARARRTAPYGIVEEALYQALVPEGPSVSRRRHRIARRHPGREARRRAASSSSSTTRRTTRRLRSRATSTRPRPRSSSRSTSAR